MESGNLLPLLSGFCTFYIGLMFSHTLVQVNIWSKLARVVDGFVISCSRVSSFRSQITISDIMVTELRIARTLVAIISWIQTVCLLLPYFLATSKVISGRVLTCDSMHSWRLHSAVSLGDHATSNSSWYLTQSNYPDTEPTSPCPALMMPSAWLVSDMYQFKSFIWLDQGLNLQGSDSPISQNGRQRSHGMAEWVGRWYVI